MADTPRQEIKLFYCYARKDKPLRDELEIHLSWVKRRYQLTTWYDREILPGEEWEQAIDKNLNTAHLILLLVSPDFMNSDYAFGKEMQRALARHKEGTCRVIPILLRPTYWEEAPFSSLQLLPTNARAVTSWSNPDEAFQDVVTEISRTIKDLLISLKTRVEVVTEVSHTIKDPPVPPKTKDQWINDGNSLHDSRRYEEALATYEQAIRLDPTYARVYYCKGGTLYELKRYEEALVAYEQAIHLDPNYAGAYNNKGNAFYQLKRYEEALAAYEQAVHHGPNAIAYNGKGSALYQLRRYEEALAAYEQANRLDPNFAIAYDGKGRTLKNLNRNQEAEQAYEKARQLGFRSP